MRPTFLLSTFALLTLASSLHAQKRTLVPEDYKVWETLVAPQISKDGHWVSYQIALVDGDSRLVIHNADTADGWVRISGSGATFSDDMKYVAYLFGPPKAEADKMREAKKPVTTNLAFRDLKTGDEQIIEDVQSYRFLKGGRFLLAHRYRGATKVEGGSDLVLLDLEKKTATTFGNVSAFEPSPDASLVALAIDSDSGYSGVEILDPKNVSLRTLFWGKEDVGPMDWAKSADALAVVTSQEDPTKEGNANFVNVAYDVHGANPTISRLDLRPGSKIPTGKRIAESGGLSISDDGQAVALGIQEWKGKRKPEGKPQDKVGIEIWNSRDIHVMPEQKVGQNRDRAKVAICIWRPKTNDFLQVDDGGEEQAILFKNFDYAVIEDPKPYQNSVTTGTNYDDIYLENLADGKRTKIVEKTQFGGTPSREGKYVLYFKGKDWWMYDVKSGQAKDITAVSKNSFANEEDDHTIPEKGPAGFPMWFNGDQGVLIGDENDSWLYEPVSDKLTNLTHGKAEHKVFRYMTVSRDDDGPKLSDPMYFAVLDQIEKNSGYFVVNPDRTGKTLTMDAVGYGGLQKAKDADRMIFTMQTFEKSPNLYVTNTAFTQAKPESHTNPQQANFYWGHTELVKYKSRWGKDLQGFLIYPANYEAGKTYPMVTYIYEKLSTGLHAYVNPVDWSAYNPQVLSQNGYFVFEPDIAYKGRNPGLSAVDCLEPAVDAVLAKKVGVDATKIGLIGHSWGAYQTAFVTTVSKKFAVGACGAPLTELTSMYNSFYWNAGITNQVLLETGQGRLEVPFWEDPKTYFDNSPVWQAKKRTAPLLMAFGDADGAVDWHQGQYMFNTLRRMGKPCVLLVYAGENHNYTRRPDQLDYAKRLRHYLDVYLKDAKPEPWISEGIPYLKQTGG